MEKEKILIVDDDPLILPGFKRTLSDAGYEVTTADNGTKAIELIKSRFFNLVLTDIVMEGLDGIHVLEKIKQISPKTSVILITGYGAMDTAISAVKNNASDYLLKPCKKKDLRNTVRRVLNEQKKSELEQKKNIDSEIDSKFKTLAREIDEPIDNIECYAELLSHDSLHMDDQENTIIIRHVGNLIKSWTNYIKGEVKKVQEEKENEE